MFLMSKKRIAFEIIKLFELLLIIVMIAIFCSLFFNEKKDPKNLNVNN